MADDEDGGEDDDEERAKKEMKLKQNEKFSRFKGIDKDKENKMKKETLEACLKAEEHFKECVDLEPETINCLPQL